MRYQLWQYLYIHILSSGACKNSQSSSFLLSRVRCEGTFTGHPITRFMEVHQNNLSPLLKAFLWKGNTILPIISDGVFVKQSKMHTITPTAGPSIQIYVYNETPQTIWPFFGFGWMPYNIFWTPSCNGVNCLWTITRQFWPAVRITLKSCWLVFT